MAGSSNSDIVAAGEGSGADRFIQPLTPWDYQVPQPTLPPQVSLLNPAPLPSQAQPAVPPGLLPDARGGDVGTPDPGNVTGEAHVAGPLGLAEKVGLGVLGLGLPGVGLTSVMSMLDVPGVIGPERPVVGSPAFAATVAAGGRGGDIGPTSPSGATQGTPGIGGSGGDLGGGEGGSGGK